MIRQTLEQHGGWEVSGEAADGRQAIDEAQRLKPDLVVLYLSMPVLQGTVAQRARRKDGKNNNTILLAFRRCKTCLLPFGIEHRNWPPETV